MKKLIIPVIFALLLTACGKPTVIISGDNTAENSPSLPYKDNESAQEIYPLTAFNGKGLYSFEVTGNAKSFFYLAYTDGESAAQVPVCNAPSCLHNTADCTAVFNTTGTIYSYNNQLIFFSSGFSSGYNSTVSGVQIEAPAIILADETGGNRKTLGTINGERYTDCPDAVYGDELLFFTFNNDGNLILNGISTKSGEGRQISKEALQNGCEFLGFYKNNYVFNTYEFGTDTFTNNIGLLNADDGSIKYIAKPQTPYNPQSDSNASNYFKCYNGNVYQLTTRTSNGMDILSRINCETGETSVLCEDIINESNAWQSFYAIFNDVIVIDSPQKGDDKSLPIYRRFTYNLNTGEKGEITMSTKEPGKGNIVPINIKSEMGDSLIVATNYDAVKKVINDTDGSPYGIDTTDTTYSIITKADYLSDAPNFKAINKTEVK